MSFVSASLGGVCRCSLPASSAGSRADSLVCGGFCALSPLAGCRFSDGRRYGGRRRRRNCLVGQGCLSAKGLGGRKVCTTLKDVGVGCCRTGGSDYGLGGGVRGVLGRVCRGTSMARVSALRVNRGRTVEVFRAVRTGSFGNGRSPVCFGACLFSRGGDIIRLSIYLRDGRLPRG